MAAEGALMSRRWTAEFTDSQPDAPGNALSSPSPGAAPAAPHPHPTLQPTSSPTLEPAPPASLGAWRLRAPLRCGNKKGKCKPNPGTTSDGASHSVSLQGVPPRPRLTANPAAFRTHRVRTDACADRLGPRLGHHCACSPPTAGRAPASSGRASGQHLPEHPAPSHDGALLCPPGHHLHHVLGPHRHRGALVRAQRTQPRSDHHHAGGHCCLLLPLLAHRYLSPAEPLVWASAEERDHLVRALPVE